LGELARSAWEGKDSDEEMQTQRWYPSDKKPYFSLGVGSVMPGLPSPSAAQTPLPKGEAFAFL